MDKVGAVLCTSARREGGLEMRMDNLIRPMLEEGMVVVGVAGNVGENGLYGC